MEQLLWHLLAGTRGGSNRLRIVETLLEEPMNAQQLANRLGLDYRTVRHHLGVLIENGVLARPQGDAYGARLFVAGLTRAHLGTLEQIRASVRLIEAGGRPGRLRRPTSAGVD